MSKTTLMREWAESVMNSPIGSREEAEVFAAEHVLATTPDPTMADVKWSDEKHFLAGATHKDTNEPLVMIGPAMEDKTTDCVALSLNCGYQVENRNLTPNGKKYELREVVDRPDHTGKTMDEYSPEERAGMVGMWAGYNRHEAGGAPDDFVIITGELNEAGRVPCYNPLAPSPTAWAPDLWMLTPRFDIPRAWGTDGNPELQEATAAEKPEHPETLTTVEDYENAPEGTVVAKNGWLPWVKTRSNRWEDKNIAVGNREQSGDKRRVLRWGWGE